MKVSVAICTWNRCDALRITLDHLTALRIPAGLDWELLIVNNCCTDDTDRVVGEFCERLPIRLLHEPTPGQAHARNHVIREARGTYIVWTDDDVLVGPDWLTHILGAFERYEPAWVFGPSEPQWPGQPPSWYSPRFGGSFAVLDYGPEPFVVADAGRPFYGLNFAGTRDAHLALGGFRTEFGLRGDGGGVGEDVDMFERAMSCGMRIVYTPDARVRHMIPPGRVAKRYHRRRQKVATPVYYRFLPEMFPSVPWLLGLPRFRYALAGRSLAGYLRSAFRGDTSGRFEHELQLLKFMWLLIEAARHRFRNPLPHSSAISSLPKPSSSGPR